MTTRAAGLGQLFFWILPRSCPGSSRRAARGQSWSARSRAAARTNELDAGKRRKIVKGEEGAGCDWIVRGRVLVPGAGVRSGLTSTHPAPRQGAAAMTICPGPGCSVMRSSAALAPAHAARTSSPGAWRPSRLHGRRGGVLASAACKSLSRYQARVSSLRAIAMVAIFFPRRFAMLE